ncbi:AAA family ATPase [Eubacteriales bacterium KG127]
MKPIKLEISAFGPFADRIEIDFRKFGGKGIFLVSGNTGAGKTTIFDGIIYALYGVPSGEFRTPSMMRSTYAKDDVETFVRLTFESGNNRYIIYRKPPQTRRKKRGDGYIEIPSEVYLEYPDNRLPVTKKSEVESEIKDIIGLDAGQFRQVTMIAQGEFIKVLNSSTEERKSIFRRVFQTEKFKLVQDLLAKKTTEKEQEVKSFLNKLDESYKFAVSDYDGDNLDYSDMYSILDNLYKESRVAIKQLELELVSVKNSRDSNIEKLAKLETIIENFNHLEKAQKTFDVLKQASKEIEENYNKIPILEVDETKLLERKNSLNASRPQYENLSKLKDENQKRETKLSTLKVRIQNIADSITQISKEKESIIEKISELEINIKIKGDLIKKYQAKEIKFEKISELIRNIDEYNRINRDYDKEKEIFLQIDKKYLNMAREYNQFESEYFRHQAGILAKDLKNGEPCPVCGSEIHPKLADLSRNVLSKLELDTLKLNLENTSQKRNNIKNKISEKIGSINSIENRIITLSSNLNIIKETNIEKIKIQSKSIFEEIKNDLDRAKINIKEIEYEEKILEEFRTSVLEKQEYLEKGKGDYESFKDEYNSLLGEYNSIKTLIFDTSINLEFDGIEQLNDKINEEEYKLSQIRTKIANSRKKYQNQQEKINLLLGELEGLNKSLKGKIKKNVIDESHTIQNELKCCNKEINVLEKALNEKKNVLQVSEKSKNIFLDIMPRLEESIAIRDEYKNLYLTCSGNLQGKDKIQIETFVQMTYLDKILQRANLRLMSMTQGKYNLVRRKNAENKRSQSGLDLDIHDLNNDTYRSTKSLSGGESFQASLCLALGLADEIQSTSGGIAIDTMFIDEGFGTLDEDTLNYAINNLIDLSKGNKFIGIISHVEGLKERIPKKLIVKKQGYRGSEVTVEV